MEDTLKEIAKKLDTLVTLTAIIADELPKSRTERKDLLTIASGRNQVPLSVFMAVTLALSMVIVFAELRDSDTKMSLGVGGAEIETKRNGREGYGTRFRPEVIPERFSLGDGNGDIVSSRRISE